MKKRLGAFWSRAAPIVKQFFRVFVHSLGAYLEDLLALVAGGCFVSAAYELLGGSWSKAVAGGYLLACAIVVARAKGGGGRS